MSTVLTHRARRRATRRRVAATRASLAARPLNVLTERTLRDEATYWTRQQSAGTTKGQPRDSVAAVPDAAPTGGSDEFTRFQGNRAALRRLEEIASGVRHVSVSVSPAAIPAELTPRPLERSGGLLRLKPVDGNHGLGGNSPDRRSEQRDRVVDGDRLVLGEFHQPLDHGVELLEERFGDRQVGDEVLGHEVSPSLDGSGDPSVGDGWVGAATSAAPTGPRWDTPLTYEERTSAACDWSDYRKDYGVSADPTIRAKEHSAFLAGWSSRHASQDFAL